MGAMLKFGTVRAFCYNAVSNSITAVAQVLSLKGFEGGGGIVWEPQNSLGTLENKGLFIQGFYQEMRYFCDCILSGTPAEQGSLEFALEVMKVYEAGLRSAGETVAIS